MAKFRGSVLECVQCGVDFRVPPSRAATATTCSHKCAVKQRARSIERKVELICKGCGAAFRVPRCRKDRRVFCSTECREAAPETRERKASKVGDKNGAWAGGRHTRDDGYVYTLAADHPFAAPNGYVLEHRLVMEMWLVKNDPTSPFLIEVNGTPRLSRDFLVHHKDEDKQNNEIGNLQCMTPAEHHAHHMEVRKALAFYRKHHPLN